MRIAITQRVEWLKDRGERRDCLDQAWPTRLVEIGYAPFPIPNTLSDPIEWVKAADIDGFLLTGGNDLTYVPEADNPAPERDRTEYKILEFAARNAIPVLAHCRGLQMMNTYMGGDISPCSGHVATRHSLTWRGENGHDMTEVNSYHNWGVKEADLAEEAEVLAVAEDGSIEAFRHKQLPWLALMWHPEREPELRSQDHDLIKACFEHHHTQ